MCCDPEGQDSGSEFSKIFKNSKKILRYHSITLKNILDPPPFQQSSRFLLPAHHHTVDTVSFRAFCPPPRVSLLLLLVLVRFTPRPRAKAVRELEDRPRSASCVDLGHLEIPGIAKLLSEVKPSRDAFQLFLRASWRHRAGGRSQRTERDLAAGAASAACGACNGVAGVPSPPEC